MEKKLVIGCQAKWAESNLWVDMVVKVNEWQFFQMGPLQK